MKINMPLEFDIKTEDIGPVVLTIKRQKMWPGITFNPFIEITLSNGELLELRDLLNRAIADRGD